MVAGEPGDEDRDNGEEGEDDKEGGEAGGGKADTVHNLLGEHLTLQIYMRYIFYNSDQSAYKYTWDDISEVGNPHSNPDVKPVVLGLITLEVDIIL